MYKVQHINDFDFIPAWKDVDMTVAELSAKGLNWSCGTAIANCGSYRVVDATTGKALYFHGEIPAEAM